MYCNDTTSATVLVVVTATTTADVVWEANRRQIGIVTFATIGDN